MVSYVMDTSNWEDWQCDYRFGLLLILTPEEVSEKIDRLRAKYDPRSHAICPPHISISDPLRREMTPERQDEICGILRSVKPFKLHFDKPRASTEHAGVAYPILPQQPIDNLKCLLHTASIFAGEVYQRRGIPAHMTIAEFISIEEGLRICDKLQSSAPRGSFLCDRLEFMVPDENFRFQKKDTFFLGGSEDRVQEIL